MARHEPRPPATTDIPQASPPPPLSNAWGPLLRTAAATWWTSRTQLGAALAFSAMFAIAPLLLIALAVAGSVYGEEAARGQLRSELTETLGGDGATLVTDLVSRSRRRVDNLWATGTGVVVLLWGVWGLTVRLKSALNQMWGVANGRVGLGRRIADQFLSTAVVIVSGCLMLASLAFNVWVATVAGPLAEQLPSLAVVQICDIAVSLAVHSLLLACLLKYLPDTKVPWRAAWIGGIITAALLHVGKALFGLYLSHAAIKATYGAAASFIVVLLWAYYSAQMFLLGAEVTHVAVEAGRAKSPTAR